MKIKFKLLLISCIYFCNGCISIPNEEYLFETPTQKNECVNFDMIRFRNNPLTGTTHKQTNTIITEWKDHRRLKLYGIDYCQNSDISYEIEFSYKIKESRSILSYAWLTASILTATIIPYHEKRESIIVLKKIGSDLIVDKKSFEYTEWGSIFLAILKIFSFNNSVDIVERRSMDESAKLIIKNLGEHH